MSSQPDSQPASPETDPGYGLFFTEALGRAADRPMMEFFEDVEDELKDELERCASGDNAVQANSGNDSEYVDLGSHDGLGDWPSIEYRALICELRGAGWTLQHTINALRQATDRSNVFPFLAPGHSFLPLLPSLVLTAERAQRDTEEWVEALRREAEALIEQAERTGIEAVDLSLQERFDDLRNDLDTLMLHRDGLQNYIEEDLTKLADPQNDNSNPDEYRRRTCADDHRRDCFGESV